MYKILTITIPSYNTSQYIDSCLPTFLSNKKILKDIEILIINDGSKDDTLVKAKYYENKYPETIKVVDKENGGHGSTINSGIKLASGKYFKIVDGDDWVDNNNFTNLVQQLKKIDTDMVVNPYVEYNERKKSENVVIAENKYNGNVSFDDLSLNEAIPMHSITYRTSILKDNRIHIDENAFYVDVEYILFPIPFVDNIYFFDFPVYVYRYDTPSQSVSTKNTQRNVLHHLKVVRSVISFYDTLPINISVEKKSYILSRMIKLINTQYNIYFSFPLSKSIKEKLAVFDNELKTKHPSIYNSHGYNPFVKIFRCKNEFYYFVWILNQIRLKLK